jgi:putative phosphoribosyl transferase
VPWHPELAAGAVVDGDAPQRVVNPSVVAAARLSEDDLAAVEARELEELHRRRTAYLGGRAQVAVAGRDAVLVDDGIATGATMRAALRGVRARAPRSLTLAVPVAPADTLEALASEVDRVVCLATPANFYAIGAHYRDFAQVADAEVVAMLKQADGFAAHRG